MSRRTFIRWRKTPDLDRQTLDRYVLSFADPDLYRDPGRFPPLDAPHLFGHARPLTLEVGCGSADPLCATAVAESDANFVGVEANVKSLLLAARTAAALGLDNIRFIRANVTLLYPLLVPSSLQAVWLHFPDPHMQEQFRHHRIFGRAFLDQVHRALEPGGRLSVMTDHESYFLEMLELAESDARFTRAHDERFLLGSGSAVPTRYQRHWERHGLVTRRFELISSTTRANSSMSAECSASAERKASIRAP
jgi:tRNA (guanine-N7-)-methyltransferase